MKVLQRSFCAYERGSNAVRDLGFCYSLEPYKLSSLQYSGDVNLMFLSYQLLTWFTVEIAKIHFTT